MILLLLSGSNLIATSKSIREARTVWKQYEQIDVVIDHNNIDSRIDKACKQYRVSSVIRDYKIKVARIVTREARDNMSKAASSRVWSQEVKDRISQSMKGKRNHRILHSPDAKMMISDSMRGNNNASGLLWCYDPVTLEQKRVREIPYGMVVGRPPKSISRLI